MSILYIVSTPIGNLGDFTHRAVDVLGSVGRVLAEDTRRTSILLRHYGLHTPLVSAHEHNEASRAEQVVGWLNAGEDVALVSDAGTPLLSDPGARIVRAVVEAGHTVTPIPGASALLAAIVGAGLPVDTFTFLGFLERKGRERKAALAEIAGSPRTCVVYEAPVRLVGLLEDLAEVCGGERQVVVCRELTKLHETFYRGTIADAIAYYRDTPARGEVVVLVAGKGEADAPPEAADPGALARTLLADGMKPTAAARELARRLQMSRNDAYDLVLSVNEGA